MTTMTVNASTINGCLEVNQGPQDAEQPKIVIHVAMGMLALLSVCGILGNALVIFVFSRQKHKLSSTIFILTLAVTDFITSLITMPYTVVMELMEYNIGYDVACKFYQFMKTSTIPFSAFVMVAIALDRYLCIVYPFKHIMTIRRAKITVTCLALLAFGIGVMCSLMIGTYHEVQPKSSECLVTNGNTSHVINYVDGTRANLTSPYRVISGVEVTGSNANLNVDLNITETRTIIRHFEHDGMCNLTNMILSWDFIFTYLRVYSSLFGICAVAVMILYGLTYRSVLAHRRKRLNISNKCCGLLSKGEADDHGQDHEFTTLHSECEHGRLTNGNNGESLRLKEKYKEDTLDSPARSIGQNSTRKSDNDHPGRPGGVSRAKLKKLRVANIKTALMLSIVAFLFIVAFTPAWMMALNVLSMNVIVYYLYFTYNVANPVIYAFLNNNFRTHLQAMFRCKS